MLAIGHCNSLSDYGAGKLRLRSAIGPSSHRVEYFPYDPAFPEYGPARPADLVACIDVLEHIEPHLLDACLDDLASITHRLIVLTVHTGPAKKVLSDGRNAHLIQEPPSWWLPRLNQRFDVIHFQNVLKGFFIIACPKGTYQALAHQIDFASISEAAALCRPRRASAIRQARRKFANAAAGIRRDVGAFWLAVCDPHTPWIAKVIVGAAIFSALSPIDLTPDFIPVGGYLDDVILLTLGTFIAIRLVPRRSMVEFRDRAASLPTQSAVYGTLTVILVWSMAVVAALLHATQPILI